MPWHDRKCRFFFQVLCVLKNLCSVNWISYFLWYESFRVFIDRRAFCRAYHWGENSVHFFSSVEVGRIHIQQNNTERGNYWIFIVTAPRHRPRKAAILSVMKSKAVTMHYFLLTSSLKAGLLAKYFTSTLCQITGF